MTTLIYCAAGSNKFAPIAIRHGWHYGAQLPGTVYHAPYFIDQNWRKPDRVKYMQALEKHRPALATVLDFERPEQYREVMAWAEEAAALVTEAVIVIPKVIGSIPDIPQTIGGRTVRLGYSVPTRFAGTGVPSWEFSGRDVHLLGGSPQTQMKFAQHATGARVMSADGNYAQKVARHGMTFTIKGRFQHLREIGEFTEVNVPYIAFELSCINIRNAWQNLPGYIRFANESDLPAIVRIIRANASELGGVFYPSLRRAIAARELYVHIMANQIAGFVNWHAVTRGANKDTSTIYEIAVDERWRGLGCGRALLNAVPPPVRLKCTQDNQRGNAFYSRAGMTIIETESGKHRPLNVWRMPRETA